MNDIPGRRLCQANSPAQTQYGLVPLSLKSSDKRRVSLYLTRKNLFFTCAARRLDAEFAYFFLNIFGAFAKDKHG